MRIVIILFILSLFSCAKQNFTPVIQPNCIALEVPAKARLVHPTIQSHNGYSKWVYKGYVMDYQAWHTLFHDNDTLAIRYILGLNHIVCSIQYKDSIKTASLILKIFHSQDSIQGDINKFGIYCHDSLGGKADIYTLLSRSYRAGGIGYIGALCADYYNVNVCGISGVIPTIENGKPLDTIPYNQDVEFVLHEEGHNLGSPHTQACMWNGNGTKLDDCAQNAGYSEGDCATIPFPNLPNPNKGTVMSYCHLTEGIDFLNGYGAQVADTIRSYINSSPCLIVK